MKNIERFGQPVNGTVQSAQVGQAISFIGNSNTWYEITSILPEDRASTVKFHDSQREDTEITKTIEWDASCWIYPMKEKFKEPKIYKKVKHFSDLNKGDKVTFIEQRSTQHLEVTSVCEKYAQTLLHYEGDEIGSEDGRTVYPKDVENGFVYWFDQFVDDFKAPPSDDDYDFEPPPTDEDYDHYDDGFDRGFDEGFSDGLVACAEWLKKNGMPMAGRAVIVQMLEKGER